jgi:hypothetical protein
MFLCKNGTSRSATRFCEIDLDSWGQNTTFFFQAFFFDKFLMSLRTSGKVVFLWGAVPMVFGIGKCANVCMCGMCILMTFCLNAGKTIRGWWFFDFFLCSFFKFLSEVSSHSRLFLVDQEWMLFLFLVAQFHLFLGAKSTSIRDCVRPSVGRSVRPSVGRSVCPPRCDYVEN